MRYFLLLLVSLAARLAAAQPGADRTLEAFYDECNAYQTTRYQPDKGYETLLLRSDFSNQELADLHLGDKQLVRVDLVYTAFRLDPTFNQRQLNLARLRNLAALVPGILTNEALTWNLVEQTGCASPAACQDYFHGFVLYLEKRYTAADTRREADSLTTRLSARLRKIARVRAARKSRGVTIPCGYPVARFRVRAVAKDLKRASRQAAACRGSQGPPVRFRAEVSNTGYVLQVLVEGEADPACRALLARALRDDLAFAGGFRVGRRQFPFAVVGHLALPIHRRRVYLHEYKLADSVVRKYHIRLSATTCRARLLKPEEALAEESAPPDPDADVVSKVLNRHPDWSKRVVVADVTGSMAPYTLDLLTWLQLSALREAKTFVFFNDGNDKPDKRKAIGSTGGLYDVATADFARIKAKVLEAMLAGGGGDAPENDGEAVQYAQQLVPTATEIILVADNHTFPRDARLLTGTRVPVRIILCGATEGINPKYLTLARQHGYTLHTLEADITTLSALLEGETITIMGETYLVTKHGFRLIRKA